MNLYRIVRTDDYSWDSYDSAVVAAETVDEARDVHPDEDAPRLSVPGPRSSTWTTSEFIRVEYLGRARRGTKAGVIVASFNAG